MRASEPLFIVEAELDGKIRRTSPLPLALAEQMRASAVAIGIEATIVRDSEQMREKTDHI